jgi:hypothetical protein
MTLFQMVVLGQQLLIVLLLTDNLISNLFHLANFHFPSFTQKLIFLPQFFILNPKRLDFLLLLYQNIYLFIELV